MSLFGTNGVRGKLEVLTPQLAFGLAASFANWSNDGSIALARDMRLTSNMLYAACEAGIASTGKGVLSLGLCSSPVAEWALGKKKAAGLIIVTASHNPPEWNALKFVDGQGRAVSRERGAEIENGALSKKYRQADWKHVGKNVAWLDASAEHAKAALANVDAEKIKKRKLRIALDFGNGTSSLSKNIFTSLGCEVVALNEKMDGNFPGRFSEPSEQNVQGMLKAVRENGCDFGIAWDGDSDRVVFSDERAGYVVGDKVFAIAARSLCRKAKAQKKKFVVTTVATSRAVEDACGEFGAATAYTKVGSPYLAEKMVELGALAVCGGEEVGGVIWPEFSLAKDGIFTAAKICELACEQRISELVSELPAYFNTKAKVEAEDAAKKEAGLAAAKRHALGAGGKITALDGVRVDFDDGWVIVRASGTENYVRVFSEGRTKKRAESLRDEYVKVVEDALAGLP